MKFLILLSLLVLSSCGRAQFSGDSDVISSTSVPILATGTDYYFEIGESFANQIEGEVELTSVQVFAKATWPGVNTMQFEMRSSLQGQTAPGKVTVSGSQPSTWAGASAVLSATIPANSTNYQLLSPNIESSARSFLTQGQFWILVRVRYSGLDLTNTLMLNQLYVHADGQKSLGAFSPGINLGF